MRRENDCLLIAVAAVFFMGARPAQGQMAFSECNSRSYTVVNEPTVVPTQVFSQAITVLNKPSVLSRDTAGRAFTVLNKPTISPREAFSKAFTVRNTPAVASRDAIGRAFTLCNRAVFVDADSDGVHDCDDRCDAADDNLDADGDTIPDGCDRCAGFDDRLDCNRNGTPDGCDIAGGVSADSNGNGIPDECEGDCNSNGVGDPQDVNLGLSEDCNTNGVPDECDIAGGTSDDADADGVPNECDRCPGYEDAADCNRNGIPDGCDIQTGSEDCDSNRVPDECQSDCNSNGLADACDLSGQTSEDCDGNGVPDECENATPIVRWIGPSGGSWHAPAHWNPAGVPSGPQQAVLSNAAAVDNRCVLIDPGETGVCELTIGATGSGRQILQVSAGSTLRTGRGVTLDPGGDVDLQGGAIGGGPFTNASDSLRGYGRISADVVNQGLIEARPGDGNILRLTGLNIDNQTSGTLRAAVGTLIRVESAAIAQNGTIDIRPAGVVSIEGPLVNSAGGMLTLLGGSIGADGLTNSPDAFIAATGTIDANVVNQGIAAIISDTLLVGDLQNDGAVYIQSGVLTITGNISGNGQIIGSFGGRGGSGGWGGQNGPGGQHGQVGLTLMGDCDLSVTSPDSFDFSSAILQMNGSSRGSPQRFRLLAADRGPAVSLPDASLYSIGELRIGPRATTVRLIGLSVGARIDARRALYVNRLALDPGVTLDLAGQKMYYAELSRADDARVIDSAGGGEMRRIGPRAGK